MGKIHMSLDEFSIDIKKTAMGLVKIENNIKLNTMENELKEMNEKFQNYSQSKKDLFNVIQKILNNPDNDGLKWEAKRNPFEDNTFFYDEWYFDYVDGIGKKYSLQVIEGVVRNGSIMYLRIESMS